jgi:acetoin utilization deacetylase AcuC-like enzyme
VPCIPEGIKREVVSFRVFCYECSLMPAIRRLLSRIRKRRPLKYIYSDDYWMLDIGRHVFPAKKYRMLYEQLLRMGVRKEQFIPPVAAVDEEILLVHSPKYLKKLTSNRLSHAEILALELPFSEDILSFARLSAGGTITAAEIALEEGMAFHIGGGFHHAHADHGEGFCIFNDVAMAVEKLRRDNRIERAMVVDCDVHQGNGTADIFSDKDYAFTFSIHQMDIYPAKKPQSSMDVELWSGDGDMAYLEALREHIPSIYEDFRPDILFYLAGADAYERDQLGGLNISMAGLKDRDQLVIKHAGMKGIPLVIVLAGGYAFDVEETVAIHLNTVKTAVQLNRR